MTERTVVRTCPLAGALTALLALSLAGCSDALAPASPAKTAAPRPLAKPPSDQELRDRIDAVVAFTRERRHLDVKQQAAWQVVHGILAYGPALEVEADGKLVSAVEYLLQGGTLTGWNLKKGDHGVETIVEAGSKTGQGHPDQWLGYMSQCGLSLDEPLIVAGQTYHVRDLLNQALWNVRPGMEATWTLMAASTYLLEGAEWQTKDGSTWNVEKLVDMEADQNIDDSACGGSHRLYALAIALNKHRQAGGPVTSNSVTGGWQKAEAKIRENVTKAREFQQPDGSFSVNFFQRPGTSPDVQERINRTGHILEVLTVALDQRELSEPWVRRAAVSVVEMLENTQDFDLECGSLYHAARGLALYRERMFGEKEDPAASIHK